jgi:alkyl sulfatase BDS1-like metallo-beta-lactamase superfamily hydrolase
MKHARRWRNLLRLAFIAGAAIFCATQPSLSQTGPKPATEATRAANRTALESLDFGNREDFDNAARGFIAKPDVLTIKNASGAPVWDMESFKAFIGSDKAAPDTVNQISASSPSTATRPRPFEALSSNA